MRNTKEYMNKYMKTYTKNKEEIQCDCGVKVKAYHKKRHENTKGHKKYLESIKPDKIVIQELREKLEALSRKIDPTN